MEKPKMETKDIVLENIDKIEKSFPNVMTERKGKDGTITKGIDFEKLRKELSKDIIDDNDERYEFTWVGKNQAIVDANEPIRKTLRPCIDESKNFDTTKNLYIEGDNLDVLKLLQESYLGEVKMIYIDPPYNTGEDFIYSDTFIMNNEDYKNVVQYQNDDNEILFKKNEKLNPRYHSDWCSMIYSRLKLAKNLLNNDGVIFISIDDNEVKNLRNICDEIFGESNFETDFHIKVRHENRILREDIRYQLCMEHILCYRKDTYNPNRIDKTKNSEDNYKFDIQIKNKPSSIENIGGFEVEIYNKDSWELVNLDNGFLKEYQIRGSLITQKGSAAEFYELNLRDRRDLDGEGTLYKVINMGLKGDGLGYRYIRQPNDFNFKNGFYYQGKPINEKINSGLPYPNFYDFVIQSNKVSEEGDVEYKGGKKPTALIEKMFEISGIENDEDCIILDFFAGSSTTAHSVMNLNVKDSGKRKFIMVQLPEDLDLSYEKASAKNKTTIKQCLKFLDNINKPHFLSELGKERIRRAGKQIEDEINSSNAQITLGEEPKTVPDTGFRVLKVDSSNMKDIYYSANAISQSMLLDTVSNIKEDRNGLDLLFGILIDWGLELSSKFETINIDDISVYNYANGSLVACLDDKLITENVIKEIAKLEPLRVVFRDSCFDNSASKINLEEIFKAHSPETEIKVL